MLLLRRAGLLAGLLAALPGAAGAEAARISALAGTVEVQSRPDGPWEPAVVGAEVPEGGSIRTSGDGRAELRYPDESTVWLAENSALAMETQRSILRRVSLLFGGVKARIPHLGFRRRMEFKTATAVAAVRGTELTLSMGQDGKFELQVLFGRVELRPKGVRGSVSVPQGQGFLMRRPGERGERRVMTRAEEVRGLQNWSPGLSPTQRLQGLRDRQQNRGEMRQFAQGDRDRRGRLRDLIGRQKEEDLAAGRTLIDVHGNLTRVDQRLLRPSADELQLVNLVKRPLYVYKGTAFSNPYHGPTVISNRLDSAELRLKFGADMPDELGAWPEFFKDHEPQALEASFANMSSLNNPVANVKEISQLTFRGTRQTLQDGTTQLKPDLFVGEFSCASGNEQACMVKRRAFADTSFFTHYVPSPETSIGGPIVTSFTKPTPDGALVDVVGNRWIPQGTLPSNFGAHGGAIWVVEENYFIDSAGKIRGVGSFTDTDEDPFSVFSDTAYQTLLMVKLEKNGPCGASNQVTHCPDFTQGGVHPRFANPGGLERNLDLVIAPDLGLALIQKIGAEIENFEVD